MLAAAHHPASEKEEDKIRFFDGDYLSSCEGERVMAMKTLELLSRWENDAHMFSLLNDYDPSGMYHLAHFGCESIASSDSNRKRKAPSQSPKQNKGKRCKRGKKTKKQKSTKLVQSSLVYHGCSVDWDDDVRRHQQEAVKRLYAYIGMPTIWSLVKNVVALYLKGFQGPCLHHKGKFVMTMFGRNKQNPNLPDFGNLYKPFAYHKAFNFVMKLVIKDPQILAAFPTISQYRGAKCQGAQHQAEWSTSNKFTTTIQFPVYGGRWNKSDIAKGKPVPGPVEGIPSPSQMVDSWNNIVVGWSERFPPLLTKDIAIDLATPYPEIDPAKQMKKLKPGILAQTSTHNAAGYVATNVFIGVPVPNFVRVLHCFRPLKDLVDAVAAQHPHKKKPESQ